MKIRLKGILNVIDSIGKVFNPLTKFKELANEIQTTIIDIEKAYNEIRKDVDAISKSTGITLPSQPKKQNKKSKNSK